MSETIDKLKHVPEEHLGLIQKGLVLGGSVAGGMAARKALTAVWSRSRFFGEPPLNPDEPDVTWKRATVWAVSSGVAAGISRMLGRRLAVGAAHRI